MAEYNSNFTVPLPPEPPPDVVLRQRGQWSVECLNADGSIAWREDFPNGSTTAGLNDILNVYFASGTQKANWYLGVIADTGFSSLAVGDTMSSHSGWTEFTDYNEAARPAWSPGAASGGSITNSSTTNFTNTSNGNVVRGVFLASDSTKAGTSGTLWATGLFAAARTLNASQVLKVSYTTTLS